MEEQVTDTTVDVKPKYSKKKIVRNLSIFFLVSSVSYFHYMYVWTLHENWSHYSSLSDLEREISFHSESAFYYSYYKTIVEEQPFVDGIFKIMYDRLVEYPEQINAFNRFNIHPEVIIGAIYRYLEPILNTTANRQCYWVSRGARLKPVRACAGRGHPSVFYLHAVWALHALLPASVMLHATTLSESILGGLISILQYQANHSEATRVSWTANQRENFAGPILFIQMWLLSLQLRERDKKTCFRLQVSVFILNCTCLLFWQFSQFIFLTQLVIFFIMEQLKIIDLKTLCVFLHSHFCGLHMAVLLLQGNDMLKSSLYASTFVTISVYALFFSSLRIKVSNRTDFFIESWLVCLRIAIVGCVSVYLKTVISDFFNVDEDGHVWELFLAKISNYKSFHTLIYTCSDVFDYLPWSTVCYVTKTLLLPLAVLSSLLVTVHWIKNAANEVTRLRSEAEERENVETKSLEAKNEDTDDSGIENNSETTVPKRTSRLDLDELDKDAKCEREVEIVNDNFIAFIKVLNIDPAIFYNVSQMVVFGVLAAMFMRLKFLVVTQMCVVCPLTVNSKYELKALSRSTRLALWMVILSVMLYRLYDSMSSQLSLIGEFQDIPQEQLIEWIMKETTRSSVFAGTMPILATVMLTSRRPVVAHPHYEHSEARKRAYAVYKTYGRFSSEELYQELNKLQVTYLIVEKRYCYYQSRKANCSYLDMWDAEMPAYRRRPSLCHTLLTQPADHLYPVYENEDYTVFRVHDLSVRYMPRVFDS